MLRASDARASVDGDKDNVVKGDIGDIDRPAVDAVGTGAAVGQCDGQREAVEAARGRTGDPAAVDFVLRAVTRAGKPNRDRFPLGQAAKMGADAVERDKATFGRMRDMETAGGDAEWGIACIGQIFEGDGDDAAELAFAEARKREPDDCRAGFTEQQRNGRAPDLVQKFAAAYGADFNGSRLCGCG